MFNVNLFPRQEIERVEIDGVRHYLLPNGLAVPSVTTVLSAKSDKTFLKKWIKRVGQDEADKILVKSNTRGTAVHSLIEKYLLNEEIVMRGVMPTYRTMFSSMKQYLNNITEVNGIEYPLYSERLFTAGTADCIGYYEGVSSIIDFKTSLKIKKPEWIENYYLQATCYSMMTEELLNIKVDQIVIIMGVDHEMAQVFIKDSHEYRDRVIQMFAESHEN